MTSRERMLTVLNRREPDRIPYCEFGIDRALASRLPGWEAAGPESQAADLEANPYTVEEFKRIARILNLDNLYYVLRPPIYAHRAAGQDGRLFYGEGMIRTRADLALIDLPDPTDPALYAEAEAFARAKGDYAAVLLSRVGIFATMTGMGLDRFSFALYEDRALVEAVLEQYSAWTVEVAKRAGRLGFDVFVTMDDLAFKSAPFFSPKVFREMVLPHYRRIREQLSIPWIVHSDGNLSPFLEDLLSLDIAGLHPLENEAMDIRAVKQAYGSRLCLLGNVDLNLLSLGTPEAVRATVRELIRDVGPGGGYIVTSGNSLAAYLRPENVTALSEAVREFGAYPLTEPQSWVGKGRKNAS